jgi:hypothetical protein
MQHGGKLHLRAAEPPYFAPSRNDLTRSELIPKWLAFVTAVAGIAEDVAFTERIVVRSRESAITVLAHDVYDNHPFQPN